MLLKTYDDTYCSPIYLYQLYTKNPFGTLTFQVHNIKYRETQVQGY